MTKNYDIIPDIHGQYEKLLNLLTKLGWYEVEDCWEHSDKGRKLIFLGDFIDRGEQNGKVISLIRKLEALNVAYVIMGNHELNAIYFHSENPVTGLPLRKHSQNNIEQHKSFLHEFPLHHPITEEIINWFCSLPLFLDFHWFRVIHACWANSAVTTLRQFNSRGIFSRDFYIKNNSAKSELYRALELLTKGPEATLPTNSFFTDKTGIERQTSRLAWWRHEARSWRELCVSVPNIELIPDENFQDWDEIELYPKNAPPVFFGHYWMSFPPIFESQNTLCLDCSAGTDGPLIAYHFNPISPNLDVRNITST